MTDKSYKMIEIVGTSKDSFAKAADNAVRKASESIHNLDWFEVVGMRGRIDGGKLSEYQVTVKIGFRLD
ncbi:MAG: dodecin [Thermoanaerobaculia bacterium]